VPKNVQKSEKSWINFPFKDQNKQMKGFFMSHCRAAELHLHGVSLNDFKAFMVFRLQLCAAANSRKLLNESDPYVGQTSSGYVHVCA